VAAVVLILVLIPTEHQTLEWMFTTQNNNSGFPTSMFWFYVLPLGFLLTQYTITGFDASAHVAEETGGASKAAAKGIWQSIFFSAIGGWLLLLSFLYAATDVEAINAAGGFSPSIFLSSLPIGWVKVLLVITCVGQFLCGMSCITAGSRMLFAFSRDKAVPFSRVWTKLDKNRNQLYGRQKVRLFQSHSSQSPQ
jgi:amino acid transporter